MAKEKKHSLSAEQIKIVAEAAINVFIEKYEKEKRKRERAENPVEVAKSMLKNYRTLKASVGDEIFTQDEIQELRFEFFKDLMENPGAKDDLTEMRIKAKQKRKVMDTIQISEIEDAFQKYERMASKKEQEDMRRCRILYMMYLGEEELSVQEIAKRENVAERTVYNDRNTACEIFSIFLFGSLTFPVVRK